MAWQAPKVDWSPADEILDSDLNRIGNNTKILYDSFDINGTQYLLHSREGGIPWEGAFVLEPHRSLVLNRWNWRMNMGHFSFEAIRIRVTRALDNYAVHPPVNDLDATYPMVGGMVNYRHVLYTTENEPATITLMARFLVTPFSGSIDHRYVLAGWGLRFAIEDA